MRIRQVDVEGIQAHLESLDLDGWLIYDFHGTNPVAARVLGVGGMGTRRLFIWIPRTGTPVAVAHRIELQGLAGFPGETRPYARWSELHQHLRSLVRGKGIAVEISTEDAVPYLDRVPHGVVELLTALGARVTSSGALVTRFAARVTQEELAGHRQAAERLAAIARETLESVVRRPGEVQEVEVQASVLSAIRDAGLSTGHPPIVAFGPNAAIPHYEPGEGANRTLRAGEVVLLDLWGGVGEPSVYADQTWMGFAGTEPPSDVDAVWIAVRDARESVVSHLEAAHAEGRSVSGADLDDVARDLIEGRGYGEAFLHRTGHSIDVELHGCGPHLDNFETHDVRAIEPGIVFSVEPGVYLEGRFGVRSEIDVVMTESGPDPTPRSRQDRLILPG